MEYKLITWNVNGLNSPNKRRMIFHWLRKQKCNIICLQETHIRRKDLKYLLQKNLGANFCSLALQKKREVALYLKEELEPKQIFRDTDGRYIAVEATINYTKTLIVGIYAPNGAKNSFF